jgi:NADPH:quinone reductase-like Zn-dependent oxidoreductase
VYPLLPCKWLIAAVVNVVATTSQDSKAERLRQLGAKEVVNYKSTPEWGPVARQYTLDGRGFDFIVDVGGNQTLPESLKAIGIDGIIVDSGILGGMENPVSLLAILFAHCTARGVRRGTRNQLREMIEFIEDHGIKPAVDNVRFGIKEVKEAYHRLEKQEHFAKILIDLEK